MAFSMESLFEIRTALIIFLIKLLEFHALKVWSKKEAVGIFEENSLIAS
jgi:hypothetical protein